MNSLQDEIEEMIGFKNFSLIKYAKEIESQWLYNQIEKYESLFHTLHPKYLFHNQKFMCDKLGIRIVRQAGDKQVGKNTCLTSLYKEGNLIGTLEIFFDVDNNKLKVEATC